jgi:hypothetical protein
VNGSLYLVYGRSGHVNPDPASKTLYQEGLEITQGRAFADETDQEEDED